MFLCDETILNLTAETIFTVDNPLGDIFQEQDSTEQARLLALYRQQAAKIGVQREAEKLIKSYKKRALSLAEQAINKVTKNLEHLNSNSGLEYDFYGRLKPTAPNMLYIMKHDKDITSLNIKTNELSGCIEYSPANKPLAWGNVEHATLRGLIEERYKISNLQKYKDAFIVYANSNSYHPVKNLIESIEWDGTPRICNFLHKWMKCDDNEYTQEVSRLIFAGGINRIYNAGCKFDEMPVLIGTKQGEGKSTIVRWLAMSDDFFTEVTEIEGQKGMEAVQGAWICEMGELLALTKAKEVEAVKSFLTRQVDKYRKPYAEFTDEYKRQCIFIGTTNREQFLTDKSGNRRYYPAKVYQSGYELYKHEAECKDYIRQCWAEAKALFEKGKLEPFASPKLLEIIRAEQEKAVEDDYRIGLIESYLKNQDDYVCVFQLWKYALGEEYKQLDKKTSIEIGQIMDKMVEWNKVGLKYTTEFGRQRCWGRKVVYNCDDFDEICL